MKYIIAYDLGTGGIKTSIFGEDGVSYGFRFLSYETKFPKEDFREQSPEVWWNAVKETTRSLLSDTSIPAERIVALAVSGHSLGVLPIGYDGSLLAEYVPIWNDARAKAQARAFFEKTPYDEWYLSTGNGFPAELYSIFKIMWYMENEPELYRQTHKFIGTKDYINYRMTGVLVTDRSYASGSGVFSLETDTYNEKYIGISGIDREKLPDILNSTDIVGRVLPEIAYELGLSPDTVVCAGAVDNACMALGAGCMNNGDVYCSLGTSAWIAVSDEKPVVDTDKRPYVFAHCIPGQYVSAVAIFSAGNSLRWVRDKLFADKYLDELSGGIPAYKAIDDLAAESPVGANRLLFIPTLAGGSSLDRSPEAKGCYMGLDLMHERSDVARATLEGIALNLGVALDVLRKYVTIGESMLVVGGGSKSPIWRQIFADVYRLPITTANIGEDAGSLGAAAIAAVGAGVWLDFEYVKGLLSSETKTHPIENHAEYYAGIIPTYRELLDISSRVGELLKNI